MYRVLLIDDENIIVEGLSRVIRRADYNCQVVGTAYVPFPWAYILKKIHYFGSEPIPSGTQWRIDYHPPGHALAAGPPRQIPIYSAPA